MTYPKVKIDPTRFKWAIGLTDVNKEKIYAKFPKLNKWSSGEDEPSMKELSDFSLMTRVPLGLFFLDTHFVESIELLKYRTNQSKQNDSPSQNLRETIHNMTNIQNWMHDYSVEFGGDKNSFAASLKSTMTIQSMANAIRRYLNIDVLWFKTKESGNNPGQKFNFLRAKIQELDIIVMMSGIVGTNTKRSLDINEFRAFTMIDDYVPLIFINANDSYSGRLFSLMHELTHVGIGVNSLFNDYKMDNMDNLEKYSDIEKTCNAVAAEIFVPIIFFIEMWKSIKGADVSKKIAKIADYFNVSKLVIAHRALDQKFISQHEYNEIDFKPQQNYRNTDTNTYGDSINLFFSRYDRNCLSRIKQCVETGYLLYTDAYRLTGLSRTFFDKVIAEVIKNGS